MDNRHDILQLLRQVAEGAVPPEEALSQLKRQPFEDLGYAKVDLHRGVRQGAAEVIFGQGKEPDQIEGIVRSMVERGAGNILITRLSGEKEEKLRGRFPYRYSAEARLAVANPVEIPLTGSVAVVSAGTSDLAVCEEAALTAEALGSRVHRVYDAGVAGLHRLLEDIVHQFILDPGPERLFRHFIKIVHVLLPLSDLFTASAIRCGSTVQPLRIASLVY